MKTRTMKAKKSLLVILGVVIIASALFVLIKASKQNDLSQWPSIEIPGYYLTAHLFPNPEYIPSETGSATPILSVRRKDGSIYKEIPVPYESAMVIYAADSKHVYIGGQAPMTRQNILIVDINTGQVQQLYFGLGGSEGMAEGILFNENAWYMAYVDKKYDSSSTKLFVHDFATNTDQVVASWPRDYSTVYYWNGMTLVYTTDSGEKTFNFE